MSLSIELPIRVYIEDTDAGGIVYYVNYLKFMERARTELMRDLGYGKAALFAQDKMFVVHSLNANYHLSAVLDDELTVSAAIESYSKVAVVFKQCVYRGAELLCEGNVKVACISRETRKPLAMPAELMAQLLNKLPRNKLVNG